MKPSCKALKDPCEAFESPGEAMKPPCEALKAPCEALTTPCKALEAPCKAMIADCMLLQKQRCNRTLDSNIRDFHPPNQKHIKVASSGCACVKGIILREGWPLLPSSKMASKSFQNPIIFWISCLGFFFLTRGRGYGLGVQVFRVALARRAPALRAQ